MSHSTSTSCEPGSEWSELWDALSTVADPTLAAKCRRVVQSCMSTMSQSERRQSILRDTEALLLNENPGGRTNSMAVSMEILPKHLDTAKTELMQTSSQLAELQTIIVSLEKEKSLLQLKSNELSTENGKTLDPRITALQFANEELQQHTTQQREIATKLRKESQDLADIYSKNLASHLSSKATQSSLSADLARINPTPKAEADHAETIFNNYVAKLGQMQESIAFLEKNEKEAKRAAVAIEVELKNVMDNIIAYQKEKEIREQKAVELQNELDSQGSLRCSHEQSLSFLHTKEEELDFKMKQVDGSMKFQEKLINKSRQQLFEARKTLDETMKLLPPLEQQSIIAQKECLTINEQIQHQHILIDEVRVEIENNLKFLLGQLESEYPTETTDTKKLQVEISEMHLVVKRLHDLHSTLKHELADAILEKRQKEYEARIAQNRIVSAQHELNLCLSKFPFLEEHLQNLQNTLRNYSLLTKQIHSEGAKHNELRPIAHQIFAEYEQKFRKMECEQSILKDESAQHDRDLQQTRMEFKLLLREYEKVNTEINKRKFVLSQREQASIPLAAECRKLEENIHKLDLEVVELKRQFEFQVHNRDTVGYQVVNRNEELCLHHSRATSLQNILLSQKQLISHKEDEISVLSFELSECKRVLMLERQRTQKIPQHTNQVASLKKQLAQQRALAEQLSIKLETPPTTPASGRALSTEQITSKLVDLERRLQFQENKLLSQQRELNEIESHRLQLQKRSTENRDTPEEMFQVSEARNKLDRVDKKLASATAELTLHRAYALNLQQLQTDLEAEVKDATARLHRGEAPTLDAEREWFNMMLRRQMKLQEIRNQQEQQQRVSIPRSNESSAAARYYRIPQQQTPEGMHLRCTVNNTEVTGLL
ncbi:coiled coil flagellar protein [Pelomyxa schiedti]|nr:coiled coil flagellar protein [Pelomyxa schiedti]